MTQPALNATTGKEERFATVNSFDPSELTITEQQDNSALLKHRAGIVYQFQTGIPHVCSVCRPDQLREYFKRLENVTDADAQEVQAMEFYLCPTEDERNLNQQRIDREAMDRYNEHSF